VSGLVSDLPAHGDHDRGLSTQIKSDKFLGGYWGDKMFIETDEFGEVWGGLSLEYLGKSGDFMSHKLKFKLVLSEENAERVQDGAVKYDFSKLIVGLLTGNERLALSSSKMNRLKNYLLSSIVSMVNSAYLGAELPIKKLIEQFNELVAPKLDTILHYQLHAIPVLSHHRATDKKTLGQRMLDANIMAATYSMNQLPLTMTRQYVAGVIRNVTNLFG